MFLHSACSYCKYVCVRDISHDSTSCMLFHHRDAFTQDRVGTLRKLQSDMEKERKQTGDLQEYEVDNPADDTKVGTSPTLYHYLKTLYHYLKTRLLTCSQCVFTEMLRCEQSFAWYVKTTGVIGFEGHATFAISLLLH